MIRWVGVSYFCVRKDIPSNLITVETKSIEGFYLEKN